MRNSDGEAARRGGIVEVLDSILLARVMAEPAARSCIRLASEAVKHPVVFISAALEVMKKSTETEEKLPYTIPEYSLEMKHCDSKDPYLRPTHSIQSDAPEIIALANSLGAYQKSDWDYANAAFEWVRDKVAYGIDPDSTALGALKSGKGQCISKMNLLAALYKCGGLPTRFRMDTIGVEQQAVELFGSALSREIRMVYDSLYDIITNVFPHQMLEVQIEGRWVAADPVAPPEIACVLNYPITKLGDDPSKTWAAKYGGEFFYIDSYPFIFMAVIQLFFMFLPSFCKMVNDGYKEASQRGRDILKEAGGVEAYNARFERTYEKKSEELSSMMQKLMES
jgi:hypothetical protein